MNTIIASTEYPKDMDANPTESLNEMIGELKDQDSNMTAIGSGLRLVERLSTVHRTISEPVAFFRTLYLRKTSHCFRIVTWSFHPLLSILFQWIAVCQQCNAIATTVTEAEGFLSKV